MQEGMLPRGFSVNLFAKNNIVNAENSLGAVRGVSAGLSSVDAIEEGIKRAIKDGQKVDHGMPEEEKKA